MSGATDCNLESMNSRRPRALLRGAVAAFAGACALLALGPQAAGAGSTGAQARCSASDGCADVSISGYSTPQPIKRGRTSELKITPKNDGPGSAYGIDLQVDVPSQLKIVSVRNYGGWGCAVQGTWVRCNLGDFANQQLAVVVIKVKGTQRGTWVSNARVYSSGITDPNGGNNQVGITVGVGKR
ncbi:MAG: hypothetical protein U0R24_03410 [Solirubrobacterales bacterium]